MAKEGDLKSIELKVSVNCCEGCKKKVLKYLNIKGVLEIKIHPTLPKVTVVGTVDAQTLIKKLGKGFKKAELWDSANAAGEKGKAEDRAEKPNPGPNNDKTSKCGESSNNNKKCETSKDGDCNKGEKKCAKETENCTNNSSSNNNNNNNNNNTSPAELKKSVTTAGPPMSSQDVVGNVAQPYAHVYYTVEPPMVTLPYYAVGTYPLAPPPPPCCARDHYHYAPSGFAEYFDDENTVGCAVM
ncbi:hypothetical protein QJS10_CPB22g00452 [Acorus calamus]|uniref:HMA domain-containing protein n=1 Tax=Acorus calamus TaxID=4465 RepID=A0AAV9BZ57_ACOCL|nr:hypothetical protein QJS10_CPB22g00452 [Acorus calamus]